MSGDTQTNDDQQKDQPTKEPSIPISGKRLGKTYKRVKGFFGNDETKALKSVLKKHPKERENNLVAEHTSKMFIWVGKTNFD